MERKTSSLLTFVMVLVLVAGTVGAAGPSETPEPAIEVRMTNTPGFSPKELRIKAGQSVQWVNTSRIVHSVTTDASEAIHEGSVQLPEGAQAFNSGMLDPGESFTRTFNQPGTYQYVCLVHENVRMHGTIVVD